MNTPFYNPRKSYEENFAEGPFGAFTDGEVVENTGEPKYDFLGQKAYSPFGIPAGPLINSNFCRPAFDKGFDICVYKTVRSSFFPCHPFPNILPVKIKGDLTLEKAQSKLMTGNRYSMPISITNSFGVPSKEASIWQADVKKAISYAKKGQILVLGFMGTIRESQTAEEFIADYALVAKQAKETGVKILETNLSCPNIGNEGLVCYNLDMTEKICRAIRKEIGNTPLVFKVGYYKDYEDVKKLIEILEKLVHKGNTVVVIEHNMDLVKNADYVLDFGPEGGSGGGEVVAKGTPEEIANSPKSHTAKYLRKALKRK